MGLQRVGHNWVTFTFICLNVENNMSPFVPSFDNILIIQSTLNRNLDIILNLFSKLFLPFILTYTLQKWPMPCFSSVLCFPSTCYCSYLLIPRHHLFPCPSAVLYRSSWLMLGVVCVCVCVCVYAQSFSCVCPTLCDPVDYSLPGSSVHEIFQTRILEWVVISSSRESSLPMDTVSPVLQAVSLPLSHWGNPSP